MDNQSEKHTFSTAASPNLADAPTERSATGGAYCLQVGEKPNEEIPPSGICFWKQTGKTNSPQAEKLAKTEVVLISDIQFDETQADRALVEQLKSTILAPWGQLLTPVLVSSLAQDGTGKSWLLRSGVNRLVMANELGWKKITVSIVEGSETEIQLLVKEASTLHRALNAYQKMQNAAEWISLIQAAHHEYKPGGDKAKKAATSQQKLLPSLEALIEQHTGLKKSAFYAKYNTFKNLVPEVKAELEKNPKLAIARHEKRLARLSKYKPEEQKQISAYLKNYPNPEDAYFQALREETAAKADGLPEDEMFPIHHESFVENANRIQNGSADLIMVDPNWFLAENNREGQMWKMGSLEVAPYFTQNKCRQFVQLAVQKLNPNGHLAVLIGQQFFFEMSDIIREHFQIRWIMAYVHGSGLGTASREAYMASHWRPIVLCRRKDAPPFTSEYTQYLHDLVPSKELISLPEDDPDGLIKLLKAERELIDQRIAFLGATGNDLLSNDTEMSVLAKGYCLKKFHPWGQDVKAFRRIIRDLTKPGDFVWDAFTGSGTVGIASVTCYEWELKNGKRQIKLAPRRGMGCDVMPMWAKIAKVRIWDAQHGGEDSFEKLEKAMSTGNKAEQGDPCQEVLDNDSTQKAA